VFWTDVNDPPMAPTDLAAQRLPGGIFLLMQSSGRIVAI
jgi:hypothetical protein